MKQKIAHQVMVYKMELSQINKNGSLPCPSCHAHISPDDKTEKVYTLLDVNMSKNGLEEIVIQCKKCQSQIYIGGFSGAEQLLKHNQPQRRCNVA
jgi:hypothetical protein